MTAGEGHSEQERLNALLEPFGYPPLRCDGVIGARTLQARSAARLLSEERTHRAAARWVLVDKAAQALLGGDRDGTVRFVFPATTGTPEHETREVTDVPAFRFEPATANAGWRNSTTFPVGSDDARGGNMYRPIYFSRGQAIHGSDRVPPHPATQGCVCVIPEHQDLVVRWLGLDGIDDALWDADRIDLTVTVRGRFSPWGDPA